MFLVLLAAACSTEKDKFVNREYHKLTTHYNGYFNGNESFKEGVEKLENTVIDDYEQILPAYILGTSDDAKSIYPQMDRALDKAAKVVRRHSMVIKGEEKNEWIDDNYLLIGKARFYKQEYIASLEAFNYVSLQFNEGPLYHESMWWAARAYLALKNYTQAIYTLEVMETTGKIPNSLKAEVHAIYAQIHAEQKEYEYAIESMTRAISMSTSKERKSRYTFILAQLYEADGSCNRAIQYYAAVLKMKATYVMEFNAQIQRALCISGYQRNPAPLIAALEELAAEEKNLDYLDQIYFALGEIYWDTGEEDKAKESYRYSAYYSTNNYTQKAKSYLRLAEITFDEGNYRHAQAYYDSTMTVLPPEFERYEEIKQLAENLDELVGYFVTIETNDSLLRLGRMKPGDREAAVDKYIAQLQEEQRQREAEMREGFGQQMAMMRDNQNRSGGSTTQGNWYFYNPSTVSLGRTEFQRIWGDRRLEDNWRRENKRTFSAEEIEEEFGDTITITIGDSTYRAYKYDRSIYLATLPTTQEAQDSLDAQNIEAYYGLALLYKEKLFDNVKAAETFERLLDKYPDNQYRIQEYFYLFRLFTDLNKPAKAEEYKQKLIDLDPNSDFAKILKDPSYADVIEAERNRSNEAYSVCFRDFESGRYTACAKKCEANLTQFAGDPLEPKFAFLLALSKGKRNEKTLVEEMRKVVLNYPYSEEGIEAQKMIAFYTGETEEVLAEKEEVDSIGLFMAEEAKKFMPSMGEAHFYVLLFPAASTNANDLSTFLSDFNQKYFSLKNLNVRGLFLDKSMQMITVRTLSNGDEAKKYFNALKSEPNIAESLAGQEWRHFVVSQSNFGILFQNKYPAAYQIFFSEQYLP